MVIVLFVAVTIVNLGRDLSRVVAVVSVIVGPRLLLQSSFALAFRSHQLVSVIEIHRGSFRTRSAVQYLIAPFAVVLRACRGFIYDY